MNIPPIRFRGIEEGTDGDNCIPMMEPMDLTYALVAKMFCTPRDLDVTDFKFNWHYLKFFGFDPEKCLKFRGLGLLDVWTNNFMCGEKRFFEKSYCEEMPDLRIRDKKWKFSNKTVVDF